VNIKRIEPAAFSDEPYKLIPMAPVTSNQVACIGYDASTKTLACQFTRGPGHVYHYPNVEPEVHAQFVGAESISKFFGQHIKPLPFKKFPAPKAKGDEAKAAA
jgi:hypothetical protein